jgi:hypothetical protein
VNFVNVFVLCPSNNPILTKMNMNASISYYYYISEINRLKIEWHIDGIENGAILSVSFKTCIPNFMSRYF